MSGQGRVCPVCGATGDGNFCARCGQPLTDPADRAVTCPACGTGLDADAIYCSECGAPVAAPPSKPLRDRLPWILSGLALVAFAVAISLMIGESVGERAEGMPPTGAVIPSPGQENTSGGAGQGGAADPSRIDLSSMSGREAADRLFDRAMRTEAAGDSAQARFFADMGLQAYGGLPPTDIDADARFHIGLLRLMTGDRAGARESADAILTGNPDHLLAWIIRINVAEALADEAALAEARESFRSALASERASGRPEYAQHAGLIDEQARRVSATP